KVCKNEASMYKTVESRLVSCFSAEGCENFPNWRQGVRHFRRRWERPSQLSASNSNPQKLAFQSSMGALALTANGSHRPTLSWQTSLSAIGEIVEQGHAVRLGPKSDLASVSERFVVPFNGFLAVQTHPEVRPRKSTRRVCHCLEGTFISALCILVGDPSI